MGKYIDDVYRGMGQVRVDESGPALEKRRTALAALPPIERTDEDGFLTETRQFRGLTQEQAIRYLTQLGGTRRDAHTVTGNGWEARLSSRKVPVGPSYRLTEVTISWAGDQDKLEDVILRFRLKAFRAPG